MGLRGGDGDPSLLLLTCGSRPHKVTVSTAEEAETNGADKVGAGRADPVLVALADEPCNNEGSAWLLDKALAEVL